MKTSFSGILLVNKPTGMTSHDVVGKIRRLYNTREVGHTGTLDPMATGLLVVLVGRAVKASELIVSDGKTYRAGLLLGVTTDTEDTSGAVISTCNRIPPCEEVEQACSSFVGKIKQVPPMYSALKVGGKKLVDLARQGIEVERAARDVEILSLSVTPHRLPAAYDLVVECSKGTYIRTLCADIGKKLGCGGAMSALERVKSGRFSLEDAYTLDELETMAFDERVAVLRPVEEVFQEYPILQLPSFYEKLAKNGCEIYQTKIKTDFSLCQRLRLYDGNGFYALAEVKEFPDGSAIKIIKRFAD